MKKYIIVLFAFILLFSIGLKVKADTTGTLESKRAKILSAEIANIDANFTIDKTPRVIIFLGIPAQHINTVTGRWVADPAGAPPPLDPDGTTDYRRPKEIDYCKKWYPKTIATENYKMESIKITGSPKNDKEKEYFIPSLTTECLEASQKITVYGQVQGEKLFRGKTETISWIDYVSPYELQEIKKYDVGLIHYYPPCFAVKCSRPVIKSFVVASKVLNMWSYSWKVGQVKNSEGGSTEEVPDGKYYIQVCKSDTDICEISNSYFEIITAPIISSIAGTSSLNLNQKSEWAINANNFDGSKITYSVDWGDIACKSKKTCSTKVETSQSSTFSHSYSKEGFYTATFIATNSSGKSTKKSLQIRVFGPASSFEPENLSNVPITVLSLNNGEILVNGKNQKIEWKDNIKDTLGKQLYDIYLSYNCLNDINYCSDAPISPNITFPIVKNVAGYSYDWQVGKIKSIETNQDTTISNVSYLSNNVSPLDVNQVTVPNGTSRAWEGMFRIVRINGRMYHPYSLKVCRAGTDICDSADEEFLIVTDCAYFNEKQCGQSFISGGDQLLPTNLNFDWKTKSGTTGNDVKMIQIVLKNEGLFSGNITGYYDSLTQSAVDKYYTKYNITQNLWSN